MGNLQAEIEAQIANAKRATAWQNVGVIREIGDGVAKIEGLTDAMLNEMIDLGHGITGLALNLEETEVGVIILGDYTQLEEGGEARTTGKLLQVPVGMGSAGPRGEYAGRADRRQRAGPERYLLSCRENGARHYPPAVGEPAGANGHHADRCDDPDWPRAARTDHRRSLDW